MVHSRCEMADSSPRILIVDDEQHQLDTVCRGLRLYGYRCEGVLSVDAAIDTLTRMTLGAEDDPIAADRDGAPRHPIHV